MVTNISQAHRIEFMQRFELAMRVPPFRRHGGEFGHLIIINGELFCCGAVSACAMKLSSLLSRLVFSKFVSCCISIAGFRVCLPRNMRCGRFRGPFLPLYRLAHKERKPWHVLVMKFGGTSVGDIERIRNVAAHVKREVDAGHQVAVVVSAMSGETNRLVGLTRDVARVHDAREYDVVVSAGEQMSVGLLAMALQDLGVAARSWLGWQIAVKTSDVHGAARIEEIDVAAPYKRNLKKAAWR
jgi:hypothetical protein